MNRGAQAPAPLLNAALQAVVLAGDLSYADNYIANGTIDPFVGNYTWGAKSVPGPETPVPWPVSGTFQPRW